MNQYINAKWWEPRPVTQAALLLFIPKKTLQEQLHEKMNQYINAKWWEPWPVTQAALLLFIPKKNGMLRTVLDAWQCNDNTIKDVTSLPDQEVIRKDVVKARYRSKIDLTDTYEQ
ncbi:hypothetical protein C0995_002322, partial [Termitomyces sp. Mi166